MPLAVTNGLPKRLVNKFGVVGDRFGDPNVEGRVITAEYEHFYLVTVYAPNPKEDLGRLTLRHEQWDPVFLAHVNALQKKKPVVFCGDLNVAHTPDDLANPKANVGKKGFTDEGRLGFENFLDAGFVDTFRLFRRQRALFLVVEFRQRPFSQYRVADRLLLGLRGSQGQRRRRRHPC